MIIDAHKLLADKDEDLKTLSEDLQMAQQANEGLQAKLKDMKRDVQAKESTVQVSGITIQVSKESTVQVSDDTMQVGKESTVQVSDVTIQLSKESIVQVSNVTIQVSKESTVQVSDVTI